MIVFVVLVGVFGLLTLLGAVGLRPAWLRSSRARWRVALAAMFLLAATGRLVNAEGLAQMIPAAMPFRLEAVYLSGLFEVLGAIGLLVPRLRRPAGWGLAALLIVVFPANINVALFNLQPAGQSGQPVYQWARLLAQPALIWLVLWATQRESAAPAPPARPAAVPAWTVG